MFRSRDAILNDVGEYSLKLKKQLRQFGQKVIRAEISSSIVCPMRVEFMCLPSQTDRRVMKGIRASINLTCLTITSRPNTDPPGHPFCHRHPGLSENE
jgi:hypothetical protein